LEKTEGQALKEKLFNDKTDGWENISDAEKQEIFKFADEYMYYLNSSKTEKEIVATSKEILLKNNFKDLRNLENLQPGDKVFYINKDRSIYIAIIGYEDIENG